jgi:hypothetical protein
MKIKTTFAYTFEDYLQLQILSMQAGKRAIVRYIILGSLAMVFIFTLFHSFFFGQLLIISLMVVGFSDRFLAYVIAQFHYPLQKRTSEKELALAISDDGLKYERDKAKVEVKWSGFEYYSQTDLVLCLWLNAASALILPKKHFSVRDWSDLTSLVSDKVPMVKGPSLLRQAFYFLIGLVVGGVYLALMSLQIVPA